MKTKLLCTLLLSCTLYACSDGRSVVNEVPVLQVRVISVDNGNVMVVTNNGKHAVIHEFETYHTPQLQAGNLMTLERWNDGIFVYRGVDEEGKPRDFHFDEAGWHHDLEEQ